MRICDDKSKHLAEILDLSKEREYWLDLTDYDVAKVLRFLIEFSRKDLPGSEAHLEFLRGHLADIANDDYLDHFQMWCV